MGTVTDSTGALLAGAHVTARNVNTGDERQTQTNDVGQYAIPNLKVGTYEVIADKEGFQRRLVNRVVLEVQALRTIDMVYRLGPRPLKLPVALPRPRCKPRNPP